MDERRVTVLQLPATESGDDADSAMDVVSMSQSKQAASTSSSSRLPTAPTSLIDLRQPYPVPNFERLLQDPQLALAPEQLKVVMSELVSMQRYARARAIKLHKHLIEAANATNMPLQLGSVWHSSLIGVKLILEAT